MYAQRLLRYSIWIYSSQLGDCADRIYGGVAADLRRFLAAQTEETLTCFVGGAY